MKNPSSKLVKITQCLTLLLCLFANPSKAQSDTVSNRYLTPGGLLDSVIDDKGNKYSIGELCTNDTIRAYITGANMSPYEKVNCNSGFFQIYLDPLSGMIGPLGSPENNRLIILCQVLRDISGLIQSPLNTNGTKVNLLIRPGTTGAGILGYASPFFNIPFSTTTSGIADNCAWITINSGRDAFEHVYGLFTTYGGSGSSGSAIFHMAAAFDFSGAINWDLTLGTPPSSSEVDLYTTMLHEISHALGFVSLINADGRSIMDKNSPAGLNYYHYYSRYDQHLYTYNAGTGAAVNPLIVSSSACSNLYGCSFNGGPAINVLATGVPHTSCSSAPDYTDIPNAIKYFGSTTQYVFTPACFQYGSSISHFEDQVTTFIDPTFTVTPSNNKYFVMSNAGDYGDMKRYLKPEERAVFCDIGYKVGTTFGNTVNLNNKTYSGGTCGYQVAGINDGINSVGAYSFNTTAGLFSGVPVDINAGTSGGSILDNDNATGFKCLEAIVGSGTFSATSGTATTTITYTPVPGSAGVQLLRYIPVDAAGHEGNITYIYVNVSDGQCITEVCEMVSNPGFENVVPPVTGYTGSSANSYVRCWSFDINTPDIAADGEPLSWPFPGAHPNPGMTNKDVVGMEYVQDVPGSYSNVEGVTQLLPTPLVIGTDYAYSFWAKHDFGTPGLPTTNVSLAVSAVPVFVPFTIGGLPPAFTSLANNNVVRDGLWAEYTGTFTCTSTGANYLHVFTSPWNNPGTYPSYNFAYTFIDDIQISPLATSCTFSITPTMCSNAAPINLTYYTTCGSPGYFTWESTPIVAGHPTLEHSPIFDPQRAYAASVAMGNYGNIAIRYDYYDINNCPRSALAHTQIGPIVTGLTTLCVGGHTTLSAATGGGVWSSSNVAVATVAGGVITGVSTGTAVISYLQGGCAATRTVTVISSLPPIAGNTSICVGATTVLSNAISGGAWTSSNPSIVSAGIGTVTGMAAGTATITYSLSGGCFVTKAVNVSAALPPITGAGATTCTPTITLSNATTGGVWSSANPVTATVTPTTGVVTPLVIGSMTGIVYTLGACSVTTTVISATPAPIVGQNALCVGSVIPLSSGNAFGGIWSSSNNAVATVGSSTGVLTGVSAGSAVITLSLSGCYTTYTITVNSALPAAITGSTSTICTGPITLSNATAGGTWISGSVTIATVTPNTGIVSGVSPGTVTITYSVGGCLATTTVTVNAPAVITGPSTTCTGSVISLSNATTGGTWSSGTPTVATVGSTTGVVSGVSAGVTIITYTTGSGCRATYTITVTAPPAITGQSSMCQYASITLSNTSTGGMWSSGNLSIATISNTGTVTGVSGGTVNITYSSAGSCRSVKTVTVTAVPISGSAIICTGPITLSSSPGGGVWSSDNVGIATVGASTGVVTGVSTGATIITYSVGGCNGVAIVTNNIPKTISGSNTICSGATATMSSATSGGTWTSSNVAVATVGSVNGIVTGVSAGAISITYTVAGGCYTTKTFSVLPLPSITGPSVVCKGNTITLSGGVSGGTWSSSNTNTTVGISTGIVTGANAGTANISYILPTGCRAVKTVTVNATAAIAGPTLVCAGATITLSDPTTGGTWTSGTPSVATVTSSTGIVSGVSGGTAVITYTSPLGCIATTSVTVDNAHCSPCSEFHGASFTTITTTTITATTTIAAGNYYVTGDVTIAGNVTVNNAICLMAPGVHIYVAPTGSLSIVGSHLYSCDGMWAGIEIRSNTAARGRVALSGGSTGIPTLLEDAIIGIKAEGLSQPAGSSTYVINCNNVIFNRNNTGILIKDYNRTASLTPGLPLEYEFHVQNTVFTCRTLDPTGHPFTWPLNTGTTGLKNIYTSTPYIVPYRLVAGTYPTTVCHNNASAPVLIGIDLNNVGVQTALNTYPGVRLGEANAALPFPAGAENKEMNLYENLNFGVRAVNANIVSHNSVYCNMKRTGVQMAHVQDQGGEGIYTAMTDGRKYRLSVEPAYHAFGPLASTTSVNVFYDCVYGVYSRNYNIVNGESSSVYSTQSSVPAISATNMGYDIESWPFENIRLVKNYIVNVAYGIVVKELNPSGRIPMFLQGGQVTITNNLIRATLAGLTTIGNNYVVTAIWIDNAVTYTPPAGYVATAQVNVDDNTINDVCNGIYLNSVQVQTSTSNRNTITTTRYPGTVGMGIALQSGIEHANCTNDWTSNNKITGPGYNRDYFCGVKILDNMNHMVTCNEVTAADRGFEFNHTNGASTWQNNTMTNNAKGFMVSAHGYIGTQGSASFPPANKWATSGTSFTWTGANYQTYTENAVPTNSSMYVASGIYKPTHNFGVNTLSPLTWYGFGGGTGNGLLPSSAMLAFNPCNPVKQALQMVAGSIEMGQKIARTNVPQLTTTYQKQEDWMEQYALYKVLWQYPEVKFFPVLNTFEKYAAESRYGLLTRIENKLATGRFKEADELLQKYGIDDLATTDHDETTGVVMADDPAADRVVENYRRFYEVCVHYAANDITKADSADIEAMARKCPVTDGAVVYNARALYDMLFDTVRIFESDCDSVRADTLIRDGIITDSTGIKEISALTKAGGQKYKLYPNPNDGNFVVQQLVVDTEPVKVEIWDAVGRSIYKDNLLFVSSTTKLTMHDIAPGMYMLQLRDNQGRIFRIKFVVN